MASRLTATSLGIQNAFNWVFLIEILVCGILALFFLFYFNRLFGTVVSYGIRAWTWHQYRAYIDISALQISPLGGRIFFKSIRYHAHNITVLVHDGHITWRYWLRQVQDAEVFRSEDEEGRRRTQSFTGISNENDEAADAKSSLSEKPRSRSVGQEEKAAGKAKKTLPCRISVKVSGVEAFIYNRSPLYDTVLEQTLGTAKSPSSPSGSGSGPGLNAGNSSPLESNESGTFSSPQRTNTFDTADTNSVRRDQHTNEKSDSTLPSWLRIFPIRIECKRAAGAVGNENTTSIIVGKLEKAAGTIDAARSGPLDLYKLLFNFDFEKVNVAMKPNRDFKEKQLDAAQRILQKKEAEPTIPQRFESKHTRNIQKKWRALTSLFDSSENDIGSLRTSSLKRGQMNDMEAPTPFPGYSQWHGLARYLDDDTGEASDEWQDVEYAKASTLADIDAMSMRFYFDMPGTVPHNLSEQQSLRTDSYANDINGSKPPDYGLDFAVHGGIVTYGPWADRQRVNLQQIFFPAPFVDATPETSLKPGATRSWSLFKIFVSVEKDVILRIPSRESSKDDKWQGRAEKVKQSQASNVDDLKQKGKNEKRHKTSRRHKGKQVNAGADARPYGWLDVTVKADSTVNYTMDMFPRSSGYTNKLDVDAKGTEIASSVNHGLLWKTGRVSVCADISQPITWNTLRSWPFDISIDDLELFILRDHLFLVIDLVNDWSSGPPPDFYTFVPYQYNMHMLFRNFCIYLNVNDSNIVNDAADLNHNNFLTLEGILDANLAIDMEKFRPVRNMITFDVLATDMRMRMLSPVRSTLSTLLKNKQVATLPRLTLAGSYSGHIEQRPGLTDTLRFDIVGSGLSLMAYGFLVRQLVNVKENYFGDYMHFKTLEEFQSADENLEVANLKTASVPKPKSINELDVILCIVAEDATVMFPTSLYSGDEFIRAELPVANLDLRILSYYLDMGLQLSPLSILSGRLANDDDDSPIEHASGTKFFVKHVDLDGHRSFGLPPDEPAYISRWNIDVGAIMGELTSTFVHDLAMVAQVFTFSFPDNENALPLNSPSVFSDVTFVQVHTDTVKIWVHVDKDAILFSADPIEVSTNDWAGEVFSQRISVLAPKVVLAVVDRMYATRHRRPKGRKTKVRTYAFFETGVSVNIVQRALHFTEQKRKQQEHLRECDARTNRAPFLVDHRNGLGDSRSTEHDFEPPCMPYPVLPPPLDRSRLELQRPSFIKARKGLHGASNLRPKSSSSSLSASVRTGQLLVPTSGLDSGRKVHDQSSSRSYRSPSPAPSFAASLTSQTPGDRQGHERLHAGLPPSTMAFSSSFSEPYFPLDAVEPDETNVPEYDQVPVFDEVKSETSSISEVIDNPDVDHEAAQTSVFIRLIPGIRAYVEAHVTETGTNLMQNFVPKTAHEVMDSFQIGVLGTISGEQQQKHGTHQVVELDVSLHSAALRIANRDIKNNITDQLDVGLRTVDTLVRMRTEPSTAGSKDVLAVHATAAQASAALHNVVNSVAPNPAVRLSISDILVWVAAAGSQSIHATVGNTLASICGEQAGYMFDLGLRLVPLIDQIVSQVQTPLYAKRDRLFKLMLALMRYNGETVSDPQFLLSSVTYILRAFPDHFRNQESWRILMRFYQVLQNLPRKVCDDLNDELMSSNAIVTPEASAKELEDWAQWRNWDIPNVSDTFAFRTLFNHAEGKMIPELEQKPLALVVRSGMLRVAIEMPLGVNEVVIRDLSLGLDQTPPKEPTGLILVDENTRMMSVLQTHVSSMAINLDWSAFALVESLLPNIQRVQQLIPDPNSNRIKPPKPLDERLSRHEFHVVASAETGVMSIQTLNVRHKSQIDTLKLSLIGTTQASERYGMCVCGLVNAGAAITELHNSQGRCIWQAILTSPSVYVDQLHPGTGIEEPPSVVIALGYREARLAIQEQAPGLIHLSDLIVLDEATKIMKLVKSIESTSTPSSHKQLGGPEQANSTFTPKVHVALLAGLLDIELSLLSTLSYKLQGTAASIRVAPSMDKEKDWGIDFDVGRQSHYFINSSSNERHEQDILDVPPLNGHIGLQIDTEVTSIAVSTSIDRVEVDATAIQGVIGVIGRPEVEDVMSAIKTGVEDVKHHLEDLIPDSSVSIGTNSEEPRKPISFDARFALLGIRVAAKTPLIRGKSAAEVELGIGPFHLVASNETSISENRLLLPEVRARINDIGAKLEILEKGRRRPCGNVTLSIDLLFKSHIDDDGKLARVLKVQSKSLEVNAYPETAPTAVDVINHLQDRLKGLDLSKEVEYLRHLRDSRRHPVAKKFSAKPVENAAQDVSFTAEDLLSIQTTVELRDIKVSWLVDPSFAHMKGTNVADLVLSLECIEFKTRGGHEARLTMVDLQLSLVSKGAGVKKRSLNSAFLPEVSFSVAYWSTDRKGSLSLKASGKPLEIRLESTFIFPVNAVQKSISHSVDNFKMGTATWQSTPTVSGAPRTQVSDMKPLASLLVEADFAGAQVYMQGSGSPDKNMSTKTASQQYQAQHGRYDQFASEGMLMHTTLQAPEISLKMEYNSNERQPTVNGELRVDASNNMLLPNVVPLLLEISTSVKEVMQSEERKAPVREEPKPVVKPAQRFFEEESIVTADPTAIFGKTKVDLGLRICKQEFGLSCQPIARVDAKAEMEDFYVTMNTIDSEEHGHFFAVSAVVTKLSAQVKHMYSRDPTFSYEMDSIVLSVLNNKHLSGTSGISAILKINPTRMYINAKQMQDLLLFHEIWVPPEIRSSPAESQAPQSPPRRPEDYFAQKYHVVASAAAFPWNATVSIAELLIDIDLGQSIGKSSFSITNLWASQAKSSNWEQNLCIGMHEMAVKSTGRMSGFIELGQTGIRTSITWPQGAAPHRRTPLIQASIGFGRLRAKAAFDYQPFAFGDIEGFDFLMYNVREHYSSNDRLVAVLDCEKAYVFCTATSPAQAVGLYQAFDRLIQDKQAAYIQSLKDIEKHLRRQSSITPTHYGQSMPESPALKNETESPISLHTDVVVTMGAISFGVFPGTFFDSQILKLEANNIQARFAVSVEKGRIQCGLGMTLGQLQLALASARRATAVPKALDVTVDDVVSSAVNAKGGIILRVPKVVASMQTWQSPNSNKVDYIFKSLFAGKIDVGWNLSRINFIKNMWTTHSRALASRLGKALPESAVRITAQPAPADDDSKLDSERRAQQEKITAEVNLPQSRYEYNALEPPIIETPQLRDMGEATPPLEWIGLHRDRLPNVTHQIIIVSLLEVAKEVEDAYEKILGGS